MTRAIILAAGQGTRLRPLTDKLPKCLVPLLGKSLLERQTDVLRECGVVNIQVIGGYYIDEIRNRGYSCSINENFATTNMVATLFSALPYLQGHEDLIISYGDIIYQPENLKRVLECKDEIGLMIDMHWRRYWELRFPDPLSDAETLILDDKGYIQELGKKPQNFDEIQGQYTGLIKIRGDRLATFVDFYQQLDRKAAYDGKNFDNMFFTSFIQALINDGWKIKAVPVENGWLEVDSVEDLQIYENLAEKGILENFCRLD